MLQWLRRRQAARRLAQADAEALIRDHGAEAYREARERERDVILTDGTTHASVRIGEGVDGPITQDRRIKALALLREMDTEFRDGFTFPASRQKGIANEATCS